MVTVNDAIKNADVELLCKHRRGTLEQKSERSRVADAFIEYIKIDPLSQLNNLNTSPPSLVRSFLREEPTAVCSGC